MEKSGCLGVIKVFSFFLFFLIVFCLAGSTGLCFHNDDFKKNREYTRKEAMLPRDQGGYAGGHDTITGEAALLPTINEGRLPEVGATAPIRYSPIFIPPSCPLSA